MSVYLTLLWYILCKHKLTYEMSVPLNCILYGWFSKPVEKSRASISNWAAAAAPAITTVFSSCQQQKNVIIWDSEWNREWKKRKLMEQRNCIYIVFSIEQCIYIGFWYVLRHTLCVRERVASCENELGFFLAKPNDSSSVLSVMRNMGLNESR